MLLDRSDTSAIPFGVSGHFWVFGPSMVAMEWHGLDGYHLRSKLRAPLFLGNNPVAAP
jgi:hypothetical protein